MTFTLTAQKYNYEENKKTIDSGIAILKPTKRTRKGDPYSRDFYRRFNWQPIDGNYGRGLSKDIDYEKSKLVKRIKSKGHYERI